MVSVKRRSQYDISKYRSAKAKGFMTMAIDADKVIRGLDDMYDGIDNELSRISKKWVIDLRNLLLANVTTQNRGARGRNQLPPWKSRTGSLAAGHVIHPYKNRGWQLLIDAAQNPRKAKRKANANRAYATALEENRDWAWVNIGVDYMEQRLRHRFETAIDLYTKHVFEDEDYGWHSDEPDETYDEIITPPDSDPEREDALEYNASLKMLTFKRGGKTQIRWQDPAGRFAKPKTI